MIYRLETVNQALHQYGYTVVMLPERYQYQLWRIAEFKELIINHNVNYFTLPHDPVRIPRCQAIYLEFTGRIPKLGVYW